MDTYPSLEAFYDDAPPRHRRLSGEVDFGVHWTDLPRPNQIPAAMPRWRVAWIRNTGEVYAERQPSGEVRVYGVAESREIVEAGLQGWTEHCGVGGLAWLAERFPDPDAEMETRLARQEQQHIEDRAQIGSFGQYIPREDIPGLEL